MFESSKSTGLSRRSFLKIVGVSGAALLLGRTAFRQAAAPRSVTRSVVKMGTVINLTLVGDSREGLELAADACLARMDELVAVLSRHDERSQVSRLNRDGQLAGAHPALVEVLAQALAVSALTAGAFDVTMKPLLDLYATSNGLPGDAQLAAATRKAGYGKLVLDANHVRFTEPGMAITLDGIAKGYVVDQGVAILRARGFDRVMVEAGGDLSAANSAGDLPWTVGVQSPRAATGTVLQRLNISNRAVATSGDYLQTFSADYANHHIIDPRTGRSAPALASATVAAPSAMLADALATALMVMGDAGVALVASLPGCDALAVSKTLEVTSTFS